ALVVRDGGHLRRCLDHRLEGQRTAGVLEEHPLALEGAGVDMREAVADFGQESGREASGGGILHGIFHVAVASAASLPSALVRRLSMNEIDRPFLMNRPSQVS